jgi:hypothetical protein
MAERARNGKGEGTSMFGLLLPVLVALVLALVLNAFSEVPAVAPESQATSVSDAQSGEPAWPGKPPTAGVEKGNRRSLEAGPAG